MNIKFGIYKPMVSGMVVQQEAIYRKVVGKRATWYYAVNLPNQGDYVYASTRNKEGFGGAILNFPLEDGTTDEVKGPWAGGPSCLKQDTGVDITDKNLMSYVICETYKHGEGHYQNGECIDVIESQMDTLMDYHYPRQVARRIAMERDDLQNVCLVQTSEGGGCISYAKLNGELQFKIEEV